MQLTLPVTAQLEITEICNFRCQHCYRLDSDYKPKNVPEETVMFCARELAENKVFNIILTGGEPLTRPRLLEQLLSYLESMDCNVSVNTNLTLLTQEYIDMFKKYNVRNLLVSCPSYDKNEYETITRTTNIHGFERFSDALKLLCDSGVHHTINMVVNQLNKDSVFKTAEFVKSIGSTSFGATPMALNPLYPREDLLLTADEVKNTLRELVRVREELGLSIDVMEALPKCVIPEEILQEGSFFTNRKCQAGLTVIAVSANGDVRPCAHNPKSYGNLIETPLKEVWKNMSSWRNMDYVPDDCKGCQLIAACHGACRINAVTINKNMKGRDIWMQKPLENINIKKNVIELEPDTKVRLVKCKLKTRPETDGYSLLCGRNGHQVTVVNDEVLKLIEMIGDKELTISEIASFGGTDADNPKVKSILRHLINRKLMLVC